MEILGLEEVNVIKDISNLSRLEKEIKAIRYRILRDIKNLFEHEEEEEEEEEENYYKPVRVGNFQSNSYIEYESNSDRNKTLSVEEYLNKIRLYLKGIINNLKKSGTWKIQLAVANNFISSIDSDEEHVIHTKSFNIEVMINDETDETMKELLDSLKNRYQNNLEAMKGSEFVFDYVQIDKFK